MSGAGAVPSTDSAGDARDNALVEAFFTAPEAELFMRHRFADRGPPRTISGVGPICTGGTPHRYLSPIEFEWTWGQQPDAGRSASVEMVSAAGGYDRAGPIP